MSDRLRRILMLAALLAVAGCLWLLPLADILGALAAKLDEHPLAGAIVYLVLFPVCVVFLVPASWFAMFAGYAFGLPAGIALASIGASAGAWAAFLNGRTLARGLAQKYLQEDPRLRALDRALTARPFAVVFLTRIALLIPYNLLNYLYSMTSIRQRSYLLPSIAGIIPAMSLFVFLGTKARSVEQILSGELATGPLSLVVALVTVFAIVAVTLLLQNAATSTLRKKLDE